MSLNKSYSYRASGYDSGAAAAGNIPPHAQGHSSSDNGPKPNVKTLILLNNRRNLEGGITFLERRSYQITVVTRLSELIKSLQKSKPDIALLSWNLKNTDMRKVYKLLTEKFRITCIVFAEENTTRTTTSLMSSGIPHSLLAPVTGPSMHMRIQALLRPKAEKQVRRRGHASRNDPNFVHIEVKGKEIPPNLNWEEVANPDGDGKEWRAIYNSSSNGLPKRGVYYFKGPSAPRFDNIKQEWAFAPGCGAVTLEERKDSPLLSAVQEAPEGKGFNLSQENPIEEEGDLSWESTLNEVHHDFSDLEKELGTAFNPDLSASKKPENPDEPSTSQQFEKDEASDALENLEKVINSFENSISSKGVDTEKNEASSGSISQDIFAAISAADFKPDKNTNSPQSQQNSTQPINQYENEETADTESQGQTAESKTSTQERENKKEKIGSQKKETAFKEIENTAELNTLNPDFSEENMILNRSNSLNAEKTAGLTEDPKEKPLHELMDQPLQESVLKQAVQSALNQTIAPVKNEFSSVTTVSNLAVAIIKSSHFKGILVCAGSSNDSQKTLLLQILEKFRIEMTQKGEALNEDPIVLEIEIPPSDFISWVQFKAEFVITSPHGSQSTVIAYFPFSAFTPTSKKMGNGVVGINLQKDLQANSVLLFDLFIHLPKNDKYILYMNKNAFLGENIIEKFSKFGVQTVFLREEQLELLLAYNVRNFLVSTLK